MSDDIVIKVDGVYKEFRLPHEKGGSIKQSLLSAFRPNHLRYERQQVLKNISFEIKKGEFFGIVGRNGSGKSTLLKIIANIYQQTKGDVQVNGRLVPFIELGVGFNPELSGRENVFLNGALLGFSEKEITEMYAEIVEFAELEKFMDQKLKNYSSGMQVRLAFSIAIRANTDILVLDEVLAVGDAAFQKKCFDYFKELKQKGKTVVLVTHDMGSVERFCTRALLIEKGEAKLVGAPNEIARQYTLDNLNGNEDAEKTIKKNRKLNKQIEALNIGLLSKQVLNNGEELQFQVSYKLREKMEVDLGIAISRNGQSIVEHNTKEIKLSYAVGKEHRLNYNYSLELLNPGVYEVAVAIFEKATFKLIGFNTDSCSFIIDGVKSGGLISKRGKWSKIND